MVRTTTKITTYALLSEEAIDNFFKQYQQVLHTLHIPLQNQFAADETGIQLSFGCTKRIIGHRGKCTTYNCQGGDQELITFLPIICADGSLTGHITIFPGKKIPNWCAGNNPLKSE